MKATTVAFPNGTRLIVKPTNFKPGEVQIAVKFGQGYSGLDSQNTVPGLLWNIGGLQEAGLGKLDVQQLQSALAGKLVSLRPGISEEAFSLSAATRPEDLETQLQLIAAQLSDPARRPNVLGRFQQMVPAMIASANASPKGVFQLQGGSLLRSGDPRTANPPVEKVQATTMADVRTSLNPGMMQAPVSIAVVGDVTVPQVIELVAKTLGAIPRTSGAATAPPLRGFPKAGIETLYHNGRADQALTAIAWPTPGCEKDGRTTRALYLLAAVVQLRLNDRVRTGQGLAYSPSSEHSASRSDPTYGYSMVTAEVEPGKIDTFRQDVAEIVQDLKANPISADELERARKPIVETLLKTQASDNAYWRDRLLDVLSVPESAADIADAPAVYQSLNADDLREVAQRYLTDSKRWELKIIPKR
jgi:zinc protease